MFSSFILIFRLTNRLEILKQNATETREARIHIHDVGLINLIRFNHGDTSKGYLLTMLIIFNIHWPLCLSNIFIYTTNYIALLKYVPSPPVFWPEPDTRQTLGKFAAAKITWKVGNSQICQVHFNLDLISQKWLIENCW